MNLTLMRFYISCGLAFVAGHITNFSVIYYAQEVLESDFLSGLGFCLCFGSSIIFGWHAGVLSDRISPIKQVIFAQSCFIIAISSLLIIENSELTQTVRTLSFVITCILAGVGWSYVAPARLAALGRLVPIEKLHSATVIFNLLIMIGFGLAPILIATSRGIWGWNGNFIMVLSFFVISTLLFLSISVRNTASTSRQALRELGEGFSYVRKTPLIAQSLLVAIFAYLLLGPVQVMLPRFAIEHLHLTAMERGIFLSVMALALITGAVLCMSLFKNARHGRVILLSLLTSGIGFIFLGNSETLASAMIFLFISGCASGVVVSLIVALMQVQVKDELRGRIMSMYTISSQVIPALSGLLAGTLLELVAIPNALMANGFLLTGLALLSLILMSRLRSYR